jgi:hypothetical protein
MTNILARTYPDSTTSYLHGDPAINNQNWGYDNMANVGFNKNNPYSIGWPDNQIS